MVVPVKSKSAIKLLTCDPTNSKLNRQYLTGSIHSDKVMFDPLNYHPVTKDGQTQTVSCVRKQCVFLVVGTAFG